MKPNGYTIYDGPSLIDGKPILAIVTGYRIPTANKKMGFSPLQTWILRKDVQPLEATATGADKSVCGFCPHRGRAANGQNLGRSCYVEVHFGVRNVWLAWERGNYPYLERPADIIQAGHAQIVRLGSYGDPAAVPFPTWDWLTHAATWSMGYTHHWRYCEKVYQRLCMASVDSEKERDEAKAKGWRTFRVRTSEQPLGEREIACPASAEMGRKTTCEDCRACSGLGGKAKVDVAIVAHGAIGRVANFGRRI